MPTILEDINSAVRDFAVEGLPSSGAHDPVKAEIRAVLHRIAIAIQNGEFTEPPTWDADLAEVLAMLEGMDASVEATAADALQTALDRIATVAAAAAAAANAGATAADRAAVEGVLTDVVLQYAAFDDYATGLAAVSDGEWFGVYGEDETTILRYKRVSGAGELQSIEPVDADEFSLAKKLSTRTGLSGAAMAANPIIDIVTIDGLEHTNVLPNRVQAASDLNLLGASRPIDLPHVSGDFTSFAPIAMGVSGGSLTATYGIAGTDAALKAVRIVRVAGGDLGRATLTVRVPPGRWTFAQSARSNAGNQTIQFGTDNWTGDLDDMALTGTYQTFTKTFTTSTWTTRTMVLATAYPSDASFTADVDNVRLTPGSTAGAVSPARMHAYTTNLVGRAGNVVENVDGTFQDFIISMGEDRQFDEISMCMIVKRTGVNAAIEPFIHQIEEADDASPDAFMFGKIYNLAAPQGIQFGKAGSFTSRAIGLDATDWVILQGSAGPDGYELWVGDTCYKSSSTPFTGFDVRQWNLLAFRHGDGGFSFKGQLAALTIWDRVTSAEEKVRNAIVSANRLMAIGEDYRPSGTDYIALGHSFVEFAGSYADRVGGAFSPYVQGFNQGVTGFQVSNLAAQIVAPGGALELIAAQRAKGRRVVVSVDIGTNDLPTTTGAASALWTAVKTTILAPLRAAGAKVIAVTMTGRNTDGGFPAVPAFMAVGRDHYNGLLRADTAAYDGLADFAADSDIGTWNSDHFLDHVHFDTDGNIVAAGIMVEAITPFWVP